MNDKSPLLKYDLRGILNAFIIVLLFSSAINCQEEYYVGSGIGDYTRLLDGKLPHNVGTYGLVDYYNPIDTTINDEKKSIRKGVHLPLKVRVLTIREVGSDKRLIYILYDLAFPSENIRRGIVRKMKEIDPNFESASLLLTATHTHSAPGGHSDYMGYEVASPGFRPDIVEVIVQRSYEAILDAYDNESKMTLTFAEATVPYDVPIAFSRDALGGYNRNPEIGKPIGNNENYKATDRLWQLIYFEKDGQLQNILNLFGAHPNRMGANVISSDTRGYASDLFEADLAENSVVLFAQNAPGDIDDEGWMRKKVDKDNDLILHPAYYHRDDEGIPHYIGRDKRVKKEGEFLKAQSIATIEHPEVSFPITGKLDYELIYVDMGNQKVPKGNYAETLNPLDYYKNDFFLLGRFHKFAQLFNPRIKIARTSYPTIGLGAIARMDDKMISLVTGMERGLRYARLAGSLFHGFKRSSDVWKMYRVQAEKVVMLEGQTEWSSAIGFKIGGPAFNLFAAMDPVLPELERDKDLGLHLEHSIYPHIVPLQIFIIGNVAILGVSGEPGNIAGQRIEKAAMVHLKERGIERVIVNGYCNENTGYIFTPEEYPSQFSPPQCGFVLYGKWTEPAFRYNFEKLSKAMLLPKEERAKVLDYSIQPPRFSKGWYEKASYQEFLKKKK